ncbi:PREDICTED: capZ-interacting protein isoform X1 [Condylura cristata]|uniref:capZ-interacting protein isoform X1 n=1 Tax=Condylura cristata TaxID=143302 RepID=UPI0006433ADA|nr:PREDICTED: capZ-interacting protein isoform X1 [Condylura cristata]XP_012584285.1 PREDICTED: capZ-interacting protein isoform X1 [Condylura cristata]XP_012584286.1 PREDICTED: capZ-interacting protein isoform X1 [Condylura cristata]
MAETNANVDDSAPPSVAQLTGRFREQAATAKETPASKPTRRKPPCSLPLFPPKVELGQNGEEKPAPNTSHPPKIKVKSSPLIEKLQANLVFNPGTLLPGASPKSPGLKAMVSPFHSPPSTPSSPGVQSRASESEEVPVSFDQPPEGSHLPCYNKVRTRGSIKRRPPSRRFRRSQSDYGDLGDFRAPEPSQENGAKEENGDEVFLSKGNSPGSPPPSEGAAEQETRRKLGRTPSRTEKPEEKATAMEKAQHPQKVVGDSRQEASRRPEENECGCPTEGNPAGEQMEKATGGKEGCVENEEEKAPAQKNQEKDAAREDAPQTPPGEAEDSHIPEQGPGKEKQEEAEALEPSCGPGASHAQPQHNSKVPETQDTPQDTIM